MNKKQLLEEISKLPDDIEFLAAKDDEGNGYRWISGVSLDYIHTEYEDDYEIEFTVAEEELEEDYPDPEDRVHLKPVAVIW